MKVLFFMSHAGTARNFESTLRGLADRGHDVHMAFDRGEKQNLPGHADLANELIRHHPGITGGLHPRLPKSDWLLVATRLRVSLDYMRFLGPEYREAPKLRRRAERWVPARVVRVVGFAPRPARAMLRAAFRSAERSVRPDGMAEAYVRGQDPDVVLFTPLLEPGSVQAEFMRAAKAIGVPTCLCVHSWDNLTNKGLIHEVPDAVTVWNEMQVEEAVDLHHVPRERMVVTGASPYDHWFSWAPSRDREGFASAAGLDPERPFVLYVGSSGFIAPDEAGFIVEWMGELRRRGLGDMQVLARAHPVNRLAGDRQSQRELEALENVQLYPAAGANPTDEDSRNDYFDSIYHSAAVTGVNTSAFLEAAVVGRPVMTLLSPRYEETQSGTLHFQHLLTAGGGLLHVARTYEEHAAQLAEALASPHPEAHPDSRSLRFTEAFIRPFGLDQPATPRVLAAVEALAGSNGDRPAAGRTTLTGFTLARLARAVVKGTRRRARRAKRAVKPRQRTGSPRTKPVSPAKAELIAAKAEARAAKAARERAKQRSRRAKAAAKAGKPPKPSARP